MIPAKAGTQLYRPKRDAMAGVPRLGLESAKPIGSSRLQVQQATPTATFKCEPVFLVFLLIHENYNKIISTEFEDDVRGKAKRNWSSRCHYKHEWTEFDVGFESLKHHESTVFTL